MLQASNYYLHQLHQTTKNSDDVQAHNETPLASNILNDDEIRVTPKAKPEDHHRHIDGDENETPKDQPTATTTRKRLSPEVKEAMHLDVEVQILLARSQST